METSKGTLNIASLSLAALLGLGGCSGSDNGQAEKTIEVKDRLYEDHVRINSLDEIGRESIRDFIFDKDRDGKPDYIDHIDEMGLNYTLVPKECANVSRKGIYCSKESIAEGFSRIMTPEIEDAATKILESRRNFRSLMYADAESYHKTKSSDKR